MHEDTQRICVLVTHSALGGAQQAARRLSLLLGERGHEAQVWYMYDHENSTAREKDTLVWPHPPRSAVEYLSLLQRLRQKLSLARFDALISFLPLANSLGQAMAKIAGVPKRVASQRNEGRTYSLPMRVADYLAGTLGVYETNVCVSKAVAASFQAYPNAYRKRIRVVYNAIELSSATSMAKDEARLSLGLPRDVPIVVSVGRLTQQKNFPFLIKAHAQTRGLHLAIAGDGDERHSLEQLTEQLGNADRVHFLGDRSAQDVARTLHAGDLYAQPTIWEGQSNALLEAMAAGLPIISSNIAPQLEVLTCDDGSSAGVALPVEEPRSWADMMERMLQDHPLREKLSISAVERAKQFNVEAMVDGFLSCLDQPRLTLPAAPFPGRR